MNSHRSLALLLALLAPAACSKPAAPPVAPTAVAPASSSAAPVTATPPSPATPAEDAASFPNLPATTAGHALRWALGALSKPPTEEEASAHFAPSFTAEVPPKMIVLIFGQLGAQLSPPVVLEVKEEGPEKLVAIVQKKDGGMKMKVSLAAEATPLHRISGLLFAPVSDAKPAASWDEVKENVRAAAPHANFLAAEIAGDKCVPLAAVDPKTPLALGSAFKLYILDTLAAQIAAGKHTWDDPITIDDAKKSLPSGVLQKEPAGKTFTVREVAGKMIAISDNTAADHLLAFVGREAVEARVKALGTATAARMLPFLSTRDVFALKLLASDDERRAYVASDVATKRKLLVSLEARDLSKALEHADSWTKPRDVDTIEWLVSPDDLCKLMASLKKRADAPATAPVGAILSLSPGIPDEKHAFEYVGFKGGSEPGVLNLTWLLKRKSDSAAGGKWLFLTVGLNDTSAALDETKGITAAASARDFLGK